MLGTICPHPLSSDYSTLNSFNPFCPSCAVKKIHHILLQIQTNVTCLIWYLISWFIMFDKGLHIAPLNQSCFLYLFYLYLTWGAEGSTGSRTVQAHFKWQSSRSAPVVEVSRHPAGLDGHQISPYTYMNKEKYWYQYHQCVARIHSLINC